MMGGFAEGEVAIANWKVWTLFSEGDVMVDVKQPFPGVFFKRLCPLGWISAVSRDLIMLVASLVPRPHPTHTRRRGLVSQVPILGLAPEVWSGQSDCRTAFIRIIQK